MTRDSRTTEEADDPFELKLQNELDVERQRFVNKWLFPWHGINIPNRVVQEVEEFGTAYRGTIAILALVAATGLGLWKMLAG